MLNRMAAAFVPKRSSGRHIAAGGNADKLVHFDEVVAGGVAGCVAKTCVAPLSRLTIMLQVQSMPTSQVPAETPVNRLGAWRLALHVWRSEGPLGFWRGNCVTLCHRLAFSSIMFSTTASCKRALGQDGFDHGPVASLVATNLLASSTASLVATCVTHPLDVVKTRVMTQSHYAGANAAVGLRVPSVLWRIMVDEGVRGLYRGFGASLGCQAPSVTLNFTCYELFHELGAGCAGAEPMWHAMLSGAAAGAVSSTLMYPVDLVRRQMHLLGMRGRPAVYSSFRNACESIFHAGRAQGRRFPILFGCAEFYRGLPIEWLKVMPGSAIMFAVNEQLLGNGLRRDPAS
mmetsp:Transcript_38307/g.105501  ORF Transcript_38307/g.105501 Transcript_38307/m.105501 type:complete len:344 (+) Transcript_38307:41-1072(+)